jgi:hypothetical protein
MKEYWITMTVCFSSKTKDSKERLYELGSVMLDWFRRVDGTCQGRIEGEVLNLAFHKMAPRGVDQIKHMVSAYCDKMGVKGSASLLDVIEMPLWISSGEKYPSGTIINEPLSKGLLFGLPQGAFIVAAPWAGNGKPWHSDFAERIGPISDREEQWKRIKAVHSDGRPCRVIWTQEEFSDRLDAIARMNDEPRGLAA